MCIQDKVNLNHQWMHCIWLILDSLQWLGSISPGMLSLSQIKIISCNSVLSLFEIEKSSDLVSNLVPINWRNFLYLSHTSNTRRIRRINDSLLQHYAKSKQCKCKNVTRQELSSYQGRRLKWTKTCKLYKRMISKSWYIIQPDVY